MTPRLSVVIPTYERRHLLGPTLETIFASPGVDLEVIVVDDGSTDGTADWLESLGEPRLRVVREAHRGIAAARNAGIRRARADYVAFFDSDDFVRPGRWTIPLAHLDATPALEAVLGNGEMLPPDDAPGERSAPWVRRDVAARLAARGAGVPEVFELSLGQIQGLTVRRAALEAVGPLDESLHILDDLDLVLRLAARRRLAFVAESLFAYRRHRGGVARNRLVVREEAIRVADKLVAAHPAALAAIGPRRFARKQARRWARLATMRSALADAPGARAAAARAVALAPINLRYRWLRRRLAGEGA